MRRKVIVAAAIGILAAAAAAVTLLRNRQAQEPRYICWDQPSSGPPARYELRFDGTGAPLVTTSECARLPALPPGHHVAEVRAVGPDGAASPPAVVEFTVDEQSRP